MKNKQFLLELNEINERLSYRINPERSRKFNLDHFIRSRQSLHDLGQNEKFNSGALRFSIVGSNGKGTVAFQLAHILTAIFPEKTTGLYTSPHLKYVTERIRIGLEPLHPLQLTAAMNDLDSYSDCCKDLSYFEYLTVLSMYIFKQRKVDIEVYEAGLGGRLDATGMVRPHAVILTSIALEHTELLGNDLQSISKEKLGIIDERTEHLFIWDDSGLDRDNIIDIARSRSPEIKIHFHDNKSENGYNKEAFAFSKFVIKSLFNTIDTDHVNLPVLPGRLETHTVRLNNKRDLTICFDSAHNIAAIKKALLSLTKNTGIDIRKTMVFTGTLPDRNPVEMIKTCMDMGVLHTSIIVSDFLNNASENFPTVNLDLLYNYIQSYLEKHRDIQSILITGSHRIYDSFSNLLNQLQSEGSSTAYVSQ